MTPSWHKRKLWLKKGWKNLMQEETKKLPYMNVFISSNCQLRTINGTINRVKEMNWKKKYINSMLFSWCLLPSCSLRIFIDHSFQKLIKFSSKSFSTFDNERKTKHNIFYWIWRIGKIFISIVSLLTYLILYE